MKNPALPDYFVPMPGISLDTPLYDIPSIVPDYEDAKVLTFPDLKLDINHDFWAQLSTMGLPGLQKMSCMVDLDKIGARIEGGLRKAEVPEHLWQGLRQNMASLLRQVIPVYERLFAGYTFSVRRSVWRLNTIHSENLHFDTYREEYPEHFARMFINLDNQPRIWNLSYPTEQIFADFRERLPDDKIEADANRFWRNMQIAMFGPGPFDQEHRHIAFFDPGDVWIVDSRRVSHQIFYGRRAVSIDFVVPVDAMLDRDKHYLALSREYQSAIKRERELA